MFIADTANNAIRIVKQPCPFGTYGLSCEPVLCYGTLSTSSAACSGHGTCIGSNACQCISGYEGPLCNTVTCSSCGTSKCLNSVYFDGTSTYFASNNPMQLSVGATAPFSIASWVLPTDDSFRVIASKYNGGVAGEFSCTLLPNGRLSVLRETTPFLSNSANNAVVLGAWNFIVLSYNGTHVKGFVNATEVTSTAMGTSNTANSVPFLIGARYQNSNPIEHFKGLMSELSFYSKSLSVDEQVSKMNNPGYGGLEPNLMAFFDFSTLNGNASAPLLDSTGITQPMNNTNGVVVSRSVPKQCKCSVNFTGNSCEIDLRETYCYGIPSNNATVCNGHGSCAAPNTCICTSQMYPSGLIANWKFDEAFATPILYDAVRLYNLSANLVSLDNANLISSSVSSVSISGYARQFRPQSKMQYIINDNSAGVTFSSFTISVWLYINDTVPHYPRNYILDFTNSVGQRAGMLYDYVASKNAIELHHFVDWGLSKEFNITIPFASVNGKWHHTALVYDGASNIRCYWNGVEQAQNFFYTNQMPFALNFTFFKQGALKSTLGAYAGCHNLGCNNYHFSSNLDEIAMFNRNLSNAEIVSIYNLFYNATAYHGADCSHFKCYDVSKSSPTVCSSHGSCASPNVCSCSLGYDGFNCQAAQCFGKSGLDPTVCGSRGNCTSPSVCTCSSGYTGSECQTIICHGQNSSNPNVCSGHGVCVAPSVCSCLVGFEGATCAIPTCNSIDSSRLVIGGSATFVEVNSNAAFELSTAYTLEAFVNIYASAGSGNHYMFIRKSGCGGSPYFLGIYDNMLVCGLNDAVASWASGVPLVSFGYKHLACTYNSGTGERKFYIDGKLMDTRTDVTGAINTIGGNVRLGYSYCAIVQHKYFDGELDEIRIWNRALSSNEVTQNAKMNVTASFSGLVGLWTFSELSGAVAVDTSSTRSTSTIIGTPQWAFGNGLSRSCGGKGGCFSNNCSCSIGYTGSFCDIAICYGVNASSSAVCNGNGTCTLPDLCTCSANYSGNTCEYPICFSLNSTNSNVCSSHGTCVAANQCSCMNGWTGNACQVPICFGFNATSPFVCNYRNGSCLLPNNCSCVNGYSGETCDTLVTCNGVLQSNPRTCSGRGACLGINNCTCLQGYTGNNCQYTMCNNISSSNNGVCNGTGFCRSPSYSLYFHNPYGYAPPFGESSSPPLILGARHFDIVATIYKTSATNATIWAYDRNAESIVQFRLVTGISGDLAFYASNAAANDGHSVVAPANTIQLNTWYTITVSRRALNVSIWINNSMIASATSNSVYDMAAAQGNRPHFLIGARYQATGTLTEMPLVGFISQVFIVADTLRTEPTCACSVNAQGTCNANCNGICIVY